MNDIYDRYTLNTNPQELTHNTYKCTGTKVKLINYTKGHTFHEVNSVGQSLLLISLIESFIFYPLINGIIKKNSPRDKIVKNVWLINILHAIPAAVHPKQG